MNTVASKLREKIRAASPYETLVTEALTLYREMYSKAKFGDARDEKLTARAYLAEAMRNGKTTVDKLRKLEALLAREPDGHAIIDAFIAAVKRGATATDGSANLRPVIANLHMVMRATHEELTALLIEAMQFGTTALELVALAVLQATEQRPETFGVIDDWDAHHAHITEGRARFAELCDEIWQAVDQKNLAHHHAGGELWRHTFRWKGKDTGVAHAPDPGAGQRLVEHLAATI